MADDSRLVDQIPTGGFDSFFFYSGMYNDRLLTEFLPQAKNRAYQRYMEIQKNILHDSERNWMTYEFFTSYELNNYFGFPMGTKYYELRYFHLPVANKKLFVDRYGVGNIKIPALDFVRYTNTFSQVFRFMIGEYYFDKYYVCRDRYHRCFIAIKNDKDDGIPTKDFEALGDLSVFFWKDKSSPVFQMKDVSLSSILSTPAEDDTRTISIKLTSGLTDLPVPLTDNAWDICISDYSKGTSGLAKITQASLVEIRDRETENAVLVLKIPSNFITKLGNSSAGSSTVTAIHRPNRRYSYIYTSTSDTLPILPMSEGGHPIPPSNIKMYKYDAEGSTRGERISILYIAPKYFPAIYDFQEVVKQYDIFIEIIDYPFSVVNTTFDNHFSPVIDHIGIEEYCESLINGTTSEYPDIVGYNPTNVFMSYDEFLNGAMTVVKGNEIRLGVKMLPEDDDPPEDISWESSNPGVASVSKYGVVTGLSIGSTVITASITGTDFKDSRVISVTSTLGDSGVNSYSHNFTKSPSTDDPFFKFEGGEISTDKLIIYKNDILTTSYTLKEGAKVSLTADMGGTLSLLIANSKDADMTSSFIKIDGEAVAILNEDGFISVSLDSGTHTITSGDIGVLLFGIRYVYNPVTIPEKTGNLFDPAFQTSGITGIEICGACADNLREYKFRKLLDLMISDPWLYTEYLKFIDQKTFGHKLDVGTPKYFKMNTGMSGELTDAKGPSVMSTSFLAVCKHDDPVQFTEPHTYIKVKCENPYAYVRVFINGILITPTYVDGYMNEIYVFIPQSKCQALLKPYEDVGDDFDYESAQLVIVELIPGVDRDTSRTQAESIVFNNPQEYRMIFEDSGDDMVCLNDLVFYNAATGEYLDIDTFEFMFNLHSEMIEFVDGVPQTLKGSEEDVMYLYTNIGELYMTQDMQPVILDAFQEVLAPEYDPEAAPNTGRIGSVKDIMNKKFALKDIRISLADPTLIGTDIVITVDHQVKEFYLDSSDAESVYTTEEGDLVFKFANSFGVLDEKKIEVYVNGTYIEKSKYSVTLPKTVKDACTITVTGEGKDPKQYGEDYKVQIKYIPIISYISSATIQRTIPETKAEVFSVETGKFYNPHTLQLNGSSTGRFVVTKEYGHTTTAIFSDKFKNRIFMPYEHEELELSEADLNDAVVDIRDYIRDTSIDGLLPTWPLNKLIDDWSKSKESFSEEVDESPDDDEDVDAGTDEEEDSGTSSDDDEESDDQDDSTVESEGPDTPELSDPDVDAEDTGEVEPESPPTEETEEEVEPVPDPDSELPSDQEVDSEPKLDEDPEPEVGSSDTTSEDPQEESPQEDIQGAP